MRLPFNFASPYFQGYPLIRNPWQQLVAGVDRVIVDVRERGDAAHATLLPAPANEEFFLSR